MLFCFNCQNDDQIVQPNQEVTQSRYKISTVNKDIIQANTEVFNKLNVINSKPKNKSQVDSNLAREVYNEEYGFTIETDFVKYIEDLETGYHSYSFPMKRDNPVDDKIENLLFHFNDKGTYDVFIVKYGFNKQEYEVLDIELLENLSTKFTAIIFDDIEFTSNDTQNLTIELVCVEVANWESGTPHNGQVHGADCTCTPDDQGWVINTNSSECTWMNTGGPGEGGNNTYPTGDTNGTGDYTPGGTPTGIVVPQYPVTMTPIVPKPWQEILRCINTLSDIDNPDDDETELTPQMIEWIQNQDNERPVNRILDFLNQNSCSEEAQISTLIKIESYLNPFILLEIDCNQIENWQVLAQNEASQQIKDKINSLPGNLFNDFEIQPIEDANGSVVNMDYYPVKINTLPNNPNTGIQFTADEFLDYFRRNINFFADGSASSFSPYCETPTLCTQETNLWNSDNPTGALIYIDIPADDGVVICSEYENDYWFFMTMNAPGAGNHPVSGTRQFGYEVNSDGSYNFFVRGVDRFNSFIMSDIAQILSGTDPFLAADLLWYTFQENMNNFVNNNNGNSEILPEVKNRVDWDKVKDVLLGDRPITDLGCN